MVKGVKHATVALATLIDVLWYVFSTLLLAAVLAGDKFMEFLHSRNIPIWNVNRTVFMLGTAAVIILIVLYRVGRKKAMHTAASGIFSAKFLAVLFLNFLFYAVMGMMSAGLYTAIFTMLSADSYSLYEAASCTGSMLVATIAGFVTPGSPGGAGIREAACLLLLKGNVDETVILSGALVMRSLSVAGDFLSFAAVWLWIKGKRKK